MTYLLMPQIIIMLFFWSLIHLMLYKKKSDMTTLSPFECGFNSLLINMPLSIQFTLLVFIFLLFDIELSILISSVWNIPLLNKEWIITMLLFLTIMMMSIIYEMMMTALKWK